MKKVLSTVAALGLVAGLASTAAAVEFKMSGKYLVEGAYLSDARGTGMDVTEATGESTPTDGYWLHTFEIKPTMKVNDKISMSSVIRLADDTIWGGQTNGDTEGLSGTNDVYVHQLYMDYASPIGKTRLGRTPAGTYGTNFMDFDKRADRVMLWPSAIAGGGLSTLFYIEKGVDYRNPTYTYTTDATTGAITTTAFTATDAQSDADSDKYVARLYYKNDNLDSGLHYAYGNNKTRTFNASTGAATGDNDEQKHELTVYGNYKMNNFFMNAELSHFFGSKKTLNTTNALLTDTDHNAWAGMLQAGVKLDALTLSAMGFYAEGDGDTANDETENALGTTGTGEMFEPLYILTGRHTGMLNNDIFSGSTTAMSNAGVRAGVVAVDYAVSNQLSLHGAIGYAQADATLVANTLQDDEYGWEYNVGAAYKLLDNLTYEAHFGYLDTGDYFSGNTTVDTTENVYLLTHSLTMTF